MTTPHKWLAGSIVLLLAVLLAWVPLLGPPEKELPGVFSQGSITVGPGQTVGKLLVADGDAIVAGRVAGWLAVVGGSVILQAGGRIAGPVLVLGGDLQNLSGRADAVNGQLILPAGSPIVGLLAWLLVGGAAAVPLAAALLLWLLASRVRRSAIFRGALAVLRAHGRRWPGLYAMTGLAVSGFLLALFVHLTQETIFHHEADLVDRAVIWLVRQFATPAADKTMIVVTALGSGAVYAGFAPLALGVLVWRGLRREAASLAICLGGAALLNFLLKNLFERARPDMFKVISVTGYSFPSGHAMVSLCFYGMLAYLLCRHLPRLTPQILVYCLTAALVTVIGFSRIYLGVHYPSDVLGGYIAGGTWLLFCVSLLWWWEIENSGKAARQQAQNRQDFLP